MMTYGIAKIHQTFTDTLTAVGMAALLRSIPTDDGTERTVMIEDTAYYLLSTAEITEKMAHATPQTKLLEPFFWEGGGDGYNLRARWERSEEKDDPFGLFMALLNLGAATTYNAIAARWNALSREDQHKQIAILLTLYSSPVYDLDVALHSYKPASKYKPWSPSLQVVNPAQGKGLNEAKAGQRLHSGGMKEFWLVEMLKYIGLMHIGTAIQLENEDIKIGVIAPSRCDFDALCQLARQFRAINRPASPVRCDIFSVLQMASLVQDNAGVQVKRLETAYYKSVGSARAVMNISDLFVPFWSKETIDNLFKVLYGIQSGGSDPETGSEHDLLVLLRDAISSGETGTILAFSSRYGDYLLRKREKHPMTQLSTTTLNEMLATTPLRSRLVE